MVLFSKYFVPYFLWSFSAADFFIENCRYLISQNYKPGEITIIAMYTGQLLLLKSLMPRTEFNGVTITSVDNFQGTRMVLS